MKINFDSHLLPQSSFHINNLEQHKLKVINSRFENCEINSKAFHKKKGNFFSTFFFIHFTSFSSFILPNISVTSCHIWTYMYIYTFWFPFSFLSSPSLWLLLSRKDIKYGSVQSKDMWETKGSVMKSFTCRDVTGDWNSSTSFYSYYINSLATWEMWNWNWISFSLSSIYVFFLYSYMTNTSFFIHTTFLFIHFGLKGVQFWVWQQGW